MTVFIMGGTGFIGSHAARAMVAAGVEVVALARSPEAEAKLAAWGIRSIRGEAEDHEAIAEGIAAADTILFVAAMGNAETAVVDWMIDHMTDTGKSLIFCSGTGVLGERTLGAWSENTFGERDDFIPSRTLDGRVQLEKRVRAASTSGLARGIVVRPPAVWSHDVPHALVTGVIDSVRKTGAACYVGAGLSMYSHIHAEDLGEIFRHVVETGQDGAVYHAVAGEVPNRWIADTVARLAGVPTRSVTIDEAIELWGKFAALVVFGVSSRSRSPRSRQEFGWAPKHTDMLAAAEVSVRKILLEQPD
jgi:nucleoside-diphosphate-sugar epimerase